MGYIRQSWVPCLPLPMLHPHRGILECLGSVSWVHVECGTWLGAWLLGRFLAFCGVDGYLPTYVPTCLRSALVACMR